ncbi:hypothetical protein IWX90DRAFT_416999 [Phyllosticta citrichinensis]|uniref:Uncharacterized protein n=1 Tax=Phyllosticta citrichinensis TaxID=1130410 RepID=A0ABR1XP71_9PEZI
MGTQRKSSFEFAQFDAENEEETARFQELHTVPGALEVAHLFPRRLGLLSCTAPRKVSLALFRADHLNLAVAVVVGIGTAVFDEVLLAIEARGGAVVLVSAAETSSTVATGDFALFGRRSVTGRLSATRIQVCCCDDGDDCGAGDKSLAMASQTRASARTRLSGKAGLRHSKPISRSFRVRQLKCLTCLKKQSGQQLGNIKEAARLAGADCSNVISKTPIHGAFMRTLQRLKGAGAGESKESLFIHPDVGGMAYLLH